MVVGLLDDLTTDVKEEAMDVKEELRLARLARLRLSAGVRHRFIL